MADVTVVERWEGDEFEMVLGYEFTFEGGAWRFASMFPVGAGTFCD